MQQTMRSTYLSVAFGDTANLAGGFAGAFGPQTQTAQPITRPQAQIKSGYVDAGGKVKKSGEKSGKKGGKKGGKSYEEMH